MQHEKIITIINEFRAGTTKKQIHKKYGDIGLFAIEKFSNQKLGPSNLHRTFNQETFIEENDEIKQDILKKFFAGEKEKEICKPYGEYGKLILSKIKEFISVPPL